MKHLTQCRIFLWIAILLTPQMFFCQKNLIDTPCLKDYTFSRIANVIGEVNTTSAMFPNTKLITLGDYSYSRNGKGYTINMQQELSGNNLCSFLESVNLHSSNPKFIVPVLASKLVAICISTSLLNVRRDNKSIQNTKDIVWTWNSGLESGSISAGKLVVDYLDGKMVKNGNLDSTVSVTPLNSGELYFFSMWSWDDQGTVIENSSANVPFMVESRLYNFSSLALLGGNSMIDDQKRESNWLLDEVRDAKSGTLLSNTNAPLNLRFFFDDGECLDEKQQITIYLFEDGLKKLIINERNIMVEGSKIFKEKLEILFVCPDIIRVKTILDNQQMILTYRS